uniref:Putative disease resistance protein At1g12290 n=1 Tax=Anthurium amnicola TaxID=1678845 RepID=A0A1D1ZGX1_9ARAE
MDSVVSIVQLFNNLWECCAPDLSYIEDIPRKVQELSDLVGDLKAMKADVNREVEKDRREPTAQGKRWLERANSIIGFADATIAEGRAAIEKDDKRSCPCFGSCCLNFSSRYQMGKDIVEATKVVTSHKEERRVLQLFHDFPKKRRVVLVGRSTRLAAEDEVSKPRESAG